MAQVIYVIGSKVANMLLGSPKQYHAVLTEEHGVFRGLIYAVGSTVALSGREHCFSPPIDWTKIHKL